MARRTAARDDCVAVVLCGGLGSRLGELTTEIPKPLLRVGDDSIVGHALNLLSRHGFTKVVVNLHHHGEQVREALGSGADRGVAIEYLEEIELSGTAGPLIKLRERLASVRDVLVVYGDLVLDEDLSSMLDFHRSSAADATLLIHQRARSNSVLVLDDQRRIVRFVERPSAAERATLTSEWVNSGVQLLTEAALAALPDRLPCDLPRDLYAPQAHELRLMGYPLSGFRVAVDSPERLDLARRTWPTRKTSEG